VPAAHHQHRDGHARDIVDRVGLGRHLAIREAGRAQDRGLDPILERDEREGRRSAEAAAVVRQPAQVEVLALGQHIDRSAEVVPPLDHPRPERIEILLALQVEERVPALE
jgi:hypothetical protein